MRIDIKNLSSIFSEFSKLTIGFSKSMFQLVSTTWEKPRIWYREVETVTLIGKRFLTQINSKRSFNKFSLIIVRNIEPQLRTVCLWEEDDSKLYRVLRLTLFYILFVEVKTKTYTFILSDYDRNP